jgi:hypothetical protein
MTRGSRWATTGRAATWAQERPDPVVRGYLDSLEVRTIALESWNAMPLLLNASTRRRPRNRIATVRKRGSFDAFLASSPI